MARGVSRHISCEDDGPALVYDLDHDDLILAPPPPQGLATWYSQRRTTIGSKLTPLCKIVRRWNGVHSHQFESFHLEVMIAAMFSSLASNHRDGLSKFFEWAPKLIGVSDPAGHPGRLDDYLTSDARNAINSRFAEPSAGRRRRPPPRSGVITPRRSGFG